MKKKIERLLDNLLRPRCAGEEGFTASYQAIVDLHNKQRDAIRDAHRIGDAMTGTIECSCDLCADE